MQPSAERRRRPAVNGSIQTRATESLLPRRSPPEYLISSNIRIFPPPYGGIMRRGREIIPIKASSCQFLVNIVVRVAYAVVGTVADYLDSL